MSDRQLTLVFQSDTSQAIAGMHKLAVELQSLEAQVNGAGVNVGQMTQQFVGLNDQIDKAAVGMNSVGKSSNGMLVEMIGVQAGFAVIQAGVGIFGELGDMANKARDRIKEMAIETMDLREEMRELANMKGAGGPDNEVFGETLDMAVKAGMLPKEMVAYLEQFEGSVPAGEDKGHIDPKTKQELALEGAKFGVRVKLAPATAGDLAGVISQYTDLTRDKDGKEIPQEERTAKGMEQMGRVEYGLEKGRGKLETLTRSLINTAGAVVSMGGPVEDLGDLAQIQGVASTHSNPKESGTRVRQAVRALRDTKGSAGRFMTHIAGIKDSDTHVQRLEKMKVRIDKAKAQGKQADVFMRDSGFTDEEEMRAVLEQVEDLDIIKKRIADSHAHVTGKAVMDKDAAFQTKERVGVRRMQKAGKAGQEQLIGEENERFKMARENAELQLRAEGKIVGQESSYDEWIGDAFGIRTKYLGGESTREQKKAHRAEQNLIKEAERVGIPHDEAMGIMGRKQVAGKWANENDERVKVRGFNKLADQVERKGGNAYGDTPNIGPKYDEMIKEQRKTNDLLSNLARQQQPGPAAPGAQGGIPPMRGAAAPKRGI